MPDLPQNSSAVNRAANPWLKEIKELDPSGLHVLSLAYWGLENGVNGEWPSRDRHALEQQVHGLLGWKPANALAWLLSNPNGPDKQEQEASLARAIREADNPKSAAASVLGAIYSRQQAANPALQPAASELS